MPIAAVDQNRIKDYDQLNDPTKLLDTVLEAETATGVDKNYKVTFPTVIQAVANNLPGTNGIKSAYKAVQFYDPTSAGYVAGASTLVGLDSATLCVGTMCRVEHPAPARDYLLIQDSNGALYVCQDGTFTNQKVQARWVEKNSYDNLTAAIQDFNPFQAEYKSGENVKYTISGSLRIFSAKLNLVKSTFSTSQIPAPSGLYTDANWSEISPESAPNYSRLGQLAVSYYTKAERAAAPLPVGDTIEDLIDRENAGANILYVNRLVTVESGPQAGTYRVVDKPLNPDFDAWIDGSFTAGRKPCGFEKVSNAANAIALTNITENIGGFRFGDAFNGPPQQFAERLLIKYQTPGFNYFYFNSFGSGNLLAGTSYNAGTYRFDWRTSNSQNVAVNSVNLEDVNNNLALAVLTADDGNETVALQAFTVELGTTKHFRIFAEDTQNNTLSADLYLTGVLARMYGASSLTPAQMKATLTSASAFVGGNYGLAEDLGTSLANNITADCSGGKYIYYLYDASWADPAVVRAGLNPFSAYTVEPINFKDSLGNNRSYKILYTDTIQYGSAVNVNVVS